MWECCRHVENLYFSSMTAVQQHHMSNCPVELEKIAHLALGLQLFVENANFQLPVKTNVSLKLPNVFMETVIS